MPVELQPSSEIIDKVRVNMIEGLSIRINTVEIVESRLAMRGEELPSDLRLATQLMAMARDIVKEASQ